MYFPHGRGRGAGRGVTGARAEATRPEVYKKFIDPPLRTGLIGYIK